MQYQMVVNAGVTKLMEDWENACGTRNAAALASLYLKDAMIVSGTGSIVTGPAALQEYFARNLPRLGGLRLGLHEMVASGDLAYLTGYLTYDVSYPSGGSYPARVPYSMALMQQRDGSWRIRAQTGGDFPAVLVATDTLVDHMLAGTSDSVRVRLTDAMGKPYRHEPVTFEVVYGAGSVLPGVVMTDTSGYAGAEVTTAPRAGINTILARSGALPSEPLAFRAVTWSNEPTPEPEPTPVSPAKVATPVVVLDTSLVPAPVAVPGPELPPLGPLDFASRDTVVAAVSPEGRIAGRQLGETFIVVSNRAGSDSLLAVVADPDSPRLSAEFKGFTLPRDSVVSVRLALDVRPAQKLGALAFRFEFDTNVVQFREYEADGRVPLAVVTNMAARGSVGIVLSDPKRLAGRAELITLRFQTSALAGRLGRLRLVPVDVSSITPKGDKHDRIIAPSYPVITQSGSRAAYTGAQPIRP
jgi:ketosteroid isomerase-like protein